MTVAQKIAQAITLLEADVRMAMPSYDIALDGYSVRLALRYDGEGGAILVKKQDLAKAEGNPLCDFVFRFLRKYSEGVIAETIRDTNDRIRELEQLVA